MPIAFMILKKSLGYNEIFIEKHVKLENSVGPDAPFSITFNELQNMTDSINRLNNIKLDVLSKDNIR